MKLKYDLFDMVSASIMNNEPLVIVEGKDDYQIYQNISNLVNSKILVYQVNEFANYEEGCTGVIKCLEVLQPKFAEREGNINKILGIIDRDARYFRGEIPQLAGLFVTKHYSIETYFATENNLRKLIIKTSFLTQNDIDNDVLDFVQTDFINSIDTLYLLSLEALKNACVRGYDSQLGYDDTPSKISATDFLRGVMPLLNAKREELNRFATSLGISISDIKLVAKGKWFIHWFVLKTYFKMKELRGACRNETITQCRSCRVGNYNDCLFKMKQDTYRIEALIDDLMTFFDTSECTDISVALTRLN
jgi:Protein of unknown function (DUF4435)